MYIGIKTVVGNIESMSVTEMQIFDLKKALS